MRRIFSFFFVFVITFSSVLFSQTTCNSLSYETVNSFHETSTNAVGWNAQSFKVNFGFTLDSVGVNISRVLGNPGEIIISIFSDNNNTPEELLSESTPVASSVGWAILALNTPLEIEANTTYHIVIHSTNGTDNFQDSYELVHDLEGGYECGFNQYSYDSGASWVQRTETDLNFKLIGTFQNSLVAYYPFNGNANDESGNGHHGVVTGASLTQDRFGNENSAYSFDGVNDKLRIEDFNSWDNAISISLWVKHRHSLSDYIVLIDKHSEFNIVVNNDSLIFYLHNVGRITSPILPSPNQWHYVVGTYDGSQMRLYLDNVLISQKSASGVITNSIYPIFIASDETAVYHYMNGVADDVRIYNRGLSSNEIDSLYHIGGWLSIPQNLTATSGNGQVTLTWSPNTESNLEKYNIYETIDTTAGFSLIASVNTPDTTYTHTGLTNGITYYYKITAVDNAGNESGFSEVVSATPNFLTNGLVAYYPFNGNANDESGNGHHGVVTGASLTQDRFGNENSAYSFDGVNDKLRIEDFNSWDNAISISLWVKHRHSLSDYIVLIDKHSEFNIVVNNDSLIFYLHNVGRITSPILPSPNQWHYVVGTYDGSQMRLYLDNVLISQKSASGVITNSIYPIFIASDETAVYHYMNGVADDVRIYNRGLSSNEIDSLYHIGGWLSIPQNLTATSGNGQVTLTWSPNTESNLEKYNIYETTDTTAGFSLIASVNTPDTTYTHTGLTNGITYYYKITAVDNTGNESGFSEVVSATPFVLPYGINLVYPSNNSVNIPVSLRFIWSKAIDWKSPGKNNKNELIINKEFKGKKIEGAKTIEAYWFELTTDTTSGEYFVSDTTVVDTFYTVNELEHLKDYYWRVRAKNEFGWGEFTAWNKFTTLIQLPEMVELISPVDSMSYDTTMTNIEFVWTSSEFAEYYEIEISNNEDFSELFFNADSLVDTMLVYDELLSGNFYWRVKAKNVSGESDWASNYVIVRIVGVEDEGGELPKHYALQQNYPNPFNPTTNITYVIARSEATRQSTGNSANANNSTVRLGGSFTHDCVGVRNDGAVQVSLKVYDALGREVATLVNKEQTPGKYSVQFNATNLPSGVYFYTLRAGDFVKTRKMVLMK